jgi:probable phosphoglycerate mutase
LTHLYLIRHRDYIYELDAQTAKKRDKGLSTEGIRQAEALKDRLIKTGELKPEVLISSPEPGAHQTAQLLLPAPGESIVLDEGVEKWRSEDGSLSSEEFMECWQ